MIICRSINYSVILLSSSLYIIIIIIIIIIIKYFNNWIVSYHCFTELKK